MTHLLNLSDLKTSNATRGSPYNEQLFVISDWYGPRDTITGPVYIHPDLKLGLEREKFIETHQKYAQFSERFTFLQGDPVKLEFRRRAGWTDKVVEDAYAQTDNMFAVFDGVGEGQYWSGRFARYMANLCVGQSTRYLTNVGDRPGDQNRSLIILEDAFREADKDREQADRHFRQHKPQHYTGIRRDVHGNPYHENPRSPTALWPKGGSCTATVLSLVQNRLHACEVGDSQWALLRLSGSSYKCEYMSKCGYMPRARTKNTPKQLSHGSDVRQLADTRELVVEEGDIVIAASDGLWDNLIRYDQSSEVPLGELKNAIVDIANDAFQESTRSDELPFIELLGKKISEKQSVAKRHDLAPGSRNHYLGKPDDVTVLVARVTYKLLEGSEVASGHRDHHCLFSDQWKCCDGKVQGGGCRNFIRSKPEVEVPVRRTNTST
jgi:serine/threonine protein phosphatase PrpC